MVGCGKVHGDAGEEDCVVLVFRGRDSVGRGADLPQLETLGGQLCGRPLKGEMAVGGKQMDFVGGHAGCKDGVLGAPGVCTLGGVVSCVVGWRVVLWEGRRGWKE